MSKNITPPPESTHAIAPPVQYIHTTHVSTPSAEQVGAATLEKAIEVNRITARQELHRQLEDSKRRAVELEANISKLLLKRNDGIQKRTMTSLRSRSDVKTITTLLSKFFGRQVPVEALVSEARVTKLQGDANDDTCKELYCSRLASRGYFGAACNRVGLLISTGLRMHLANKATLEDVYVGIELTKDEIKTTSVIRRAALELKEAEAKIAGLTQRLSRVDEQSEALKAQIYRQQISESAGGEKLLKMMDASLKATIEGGYAGLL